MDRIKEKTPEEAERGSSPRMSIPFEEGVEKSWISEDVSSEDMGSLSVPT